MKPILMEEGAWVNSHLSLARYYGRIRVYGQVYIIVNKEGKDLFECSAIAAKMGRTNAIEPGEPADLIDARYQGLYKKMGRDKFIKMISENRVDSPEHAERIYNEYYR